MQRRTVRRGGGGIFEEQRHQSALPAAPSVPSQDGHVESSVAAVSIAQDVKQVTVWWRSLLRFTPPAALVSVLVGTGVGGNHGSVFGTPRIFRLPETRLHIQTGARSFSCVDLRPSSEFLCLLIRLF